MTVGPVWLRDGSGKTGFELRVRGLIIGFRWTQRVPGAPAGPFLNYVPRRIQLDVKLLGHLRWWLFCKWHRVR